ncbi:Chloroplast envelope quinone oxidoreductase-like protein, partial [Mucuna pruriens]
MGKLMRAVRYDSYGGGHAALKHVEVSLPTPSKDEVLIKLEAASLNPFDWKVQKGMLWPLLPRKFPYIPVYIMLKILPSVIGTDVTGEVMDVGQGVQKFKPGDKVVALVNPFSGGGLAEFAVAKESVTTSRPSETSAAECVGLPVAGLTALQAITKSIGIKLDGSGERKNILITAASGGVGHYAVQLAKLGNTHVTATCGARNIELIKSLGADEVIDYKTPDGSALKSPSGKKYDAVIHCAVGFPWSTFEPNLTMNGKVVDISPSSSSMLTFALKKLTFSKKQLVPLLLLPKGKDLQYLIDLVKEGKLKTVIDSKYPLAKAEDAWAKSIDGHATGKIIIEF